MEFMELESWGQKYEVCVEFDNYMMGNGMAILLYMKSEHGFEPFGDLTVNLEHYSTKKNCAFVDTNDFHEATDLIKKYKLGKPTGRIGTSGYCQYPEYEFDIKELNKYAMNPLPEKKEKHRSGNEAR